MNRKAQPDIGLRAVEELRRKYRSTKEACLAVGCGRNNYYQWATGDAAPGTIFLQSMAELGLDVVYILTGKRKEANT